jgi:hypothetical protein
LLCEPVAILGMSRAERIAASSWAEHGRERISFRSVRAIASGMHKHKWY